MKVCTGNLWCWILYALCCFTVSKPNRFKMKQESVRDCHLEFGWRSIRINMCIYNLSPLRFKGLWGTFLSPAICASFKCISTNMNHLVTNIGEIISFEFTMKSYPTKPTILKCTCHKKKYVGYHCLSFFYKWWLPGSV